MTRYLADTGPRRVPKSGHVTITKIENLHINTRKKITDSKNAILFDLRRKITKLSRKNRFRTVASPGACERLAVLN